MLRRVFRRIRAIFYFYTSVGASGGAGGSGGGARPAASRVGMPEGEGELPLGLLLSARSFAAFIHDARLETRPADVSPAPN